MTNACNNSANCMWIVISFGLLMRPSQFLIQDQLAMRWESQSVIWLNFPRKLCENERNWTRGGASLVTSPLPLRSVNEQETQNLYLLRLILTEIVCWWVGGWGLEGRVSLVPSGSDIVSCVFICRVITEWFFYYRFPCRNVLPRFTRTK